MVVKREVSGHRQRQALATKQQIAAAARRLFSERGYVATTIATISQAADIPAPTIYSALGSKPNILKTIAWETTTGLDIDRAHERALTAADPRTGLRLAAAIQRRQYEHMYDVVAIYQEAARTDPDIAQDLQKILANREHAFRRHLESIEAHLMPGVSLDDATAIYVTLVLPEIYRTLVIERHWTPEQYEQWLAGSLIHQLLR